MNIRKISKETGLKIGLGVLAVIVIGYGFGKKITFVEGCQAVVTKYQTAEYSEYSCETALDMDGNVYTDCDTDYWSEPASETYYVSTNNGHLDNVYGCDAELTANKYYTTCMPPVSIDHSRESYFDNYKTHVKHDFKTVFDDGDYSKERSDKYPGCLNKIDEPVIVKYWYSVNYSVSY